MRKRLDELQRGLDRILDASTADERAELLEIQPPDGWRHSGDVTLPHGNAAAAIELISVAEEEEWAGVLPHGSAQNLRDQLRTRLAGVHRET
jgi:hypothetical protein